MDCKAVETTQATSTTHLAQELITNIQCSDSSRSFTKETSASKMRSVVAGHQKLTMTDWEQTSKLILLKLREKWLKNSTLTILQSYGIWGKLERWKSSELGASWGDRKSKKSLFWSVVFSYSTQQQWTISLTMMPKPTSDNQCLKSWTNWAKSFASSTIFTWLLTNQLSLLQASQQLSAGKMLPQPTEAENAFQEFTESQNTDFYSTGIKKLTSHWKNICWL